jgi:hypothetical protein
MFSCLRHTHSLVPWKTSYKGTIVLIYIWHFDYSFLQCFNGLLYAILWKSFDYYKGHSNENWGHEAVIFNITWSKEKQWTVKGTVICFRIGLSQQFEENTVVCCLLICLQHENARPHTARHTVKQIQDLKLEVLPHLPYSPDLAPSDFHFLWSLKDILRGRHFRSDQEVKEAVYGWLAQRPKDFTSKEFML